MYKRQQLVRQYIFTPGGAGAGTIQIPGNVRLDQLLVITNVTRNTVIYNFASNGYTGTTTSFSRGNTTAFPTEAMRSDGVTTITLAYSTTGMSSSDVLQIYTENQQGAIITRPWAMGTDGWERTRVSQPQSMIDADFEYGQQPTKWQSLSQLRGYPGIYEVPGTDLSIASVTSDASYASGGQAGVESLITAVSYTHLTLPTKRIV